MIPTYGMADGTSVYEKDDVDELLKHLRYYVQHHPNCKSNVLLTSLPPQRQPCSCGLSKLLEQFE